MKLRYVVVVDDEPNILSLVTDALADLEFVSVKSFSTLEHAARHIRAETVDLIVSDLSIGAHSGVDLLQIAKVAHPDSVFIVMTAFPTVGTAIKVMQMGGFDYLVKPFKLEQIRNVVRRGLEMQALGRENVRLKRELGLLKVSRSAMSDMRLEDTLDIVLESTLSDLNVDAVGVQLCTGHPTIDRITPSRASEVDSEARVFIDEASNLALTGASARPEAQVDVRPSPNGRARSFVRLPLRNGEIIFGWISAVFGRRCREVDLRVFDMLCGAASAAISRAMLTERLEASYMQAIQALTGAIEARDRYTAGHTERVSYMAETLAVAMGWKEDRLRVLRQGCMLHDVGKIGVPNSVLNKNGPLTEFEMNIMRRHPELGVRIVENVDFLRAAVPYVLFHHERYDGKGYPMGLGGQDIPIQGRLLAVADTFDAIVSDRPYRRGASFDRATQELIDHRGTQFDAELADLFVEALRDGRLDLSSLYSRSGKGAGIRSLFADL